ncbi:MAG: hypothetical protein ACI84O_000040 [Myxococcota bacterium]|jgi:hypothetical protein
MKFLIIPLFILAACAAEPQTVQELDVTVTTGPLTYAEEQPQDLADSIAASPSELAAIKAEQDFLDEMADEGVYPETNPTQVTVKYHRSGLTVGLYNESYISRSDYYKQKRASASYKVVPDIKMGALLKALDDIGFFDSAIAGRKRYVGASVSIIVRRGTESYSLAWGPKVNTDLHEVTNMSADSIRVMYDTTQSIQLIENSSGSDFFQEESNRINQENAIRRSKPRQ